MATKVAQPVDVGLAAFTGLTPATMPVSAPVAAAITAAVGAIDPGTGSGVTPTAFSPTIDFRSNKSMPISGFYSPPGDIAFAVDATGAIAENETTAKVSMTDSTVVTAPGFTLADPIPTGAGDVLFDFVYSGGIPFLFAKVLGGVVAAGAPSTMSAPTVSTSQFGASFAFSPPSSAGSSSIIGYTVTIPETGETFTGTSSPIVATGLSALPRTAVVAARNSAGPGAASAPSAQFTPQVNSYYGQIASRCYVNQEHNTSLTAVSFRRQHVNAEACTRLYLRFDNWYVDGYGAGNTFTEKGSGGTATWTASVEYPQGTRNQVVFSAGTTGTVADGDSVWGYVDVAIPANTPYWEWSFQSNSAGVVLAGTGNSSSSTVTPTFLAAIGDAVEAGQLTDKTMSGTLNGTGNGNAGGATLIVAQMTKPSVLEIGTSITHGEGGAQDNSTGASTGAEGEISRSVAGLFGYTNVGVRADSVYSFNQSHTKRVAMAAYFTDIIFGGPANELLGNTRSASEINALMQTQFGYFPNKQLWQCTPTPVGGSNSGQTAATNNSTRVQLRALIKGSQPLLTGGVFDIGPALEGVEDSGVVGDPTWFSDSGTHPSRLGYVQIKNSGRLDASRIVRAPGEVMTSPPITSSTPVPVNSVAPAITGTAQVGQTLTVSNGTWSNTPTGYTYQWKRAGTSISGATAQTYVPVTADVGNALSCAVVASNAGGAGTAATSAATAAVIAAAAAWTPASAPAGTFSMWLDGSDRSTYTIPAPPGISILADKSGTGNDATQAVDVKRPTDATTGFSIADASHYFTSNLDSANDNEAVFAVVSLASVTGPQTLLGAGGNGKRALRVNNGNIEVLRSGQAVDATTTGAPVTAGAKNLIEMQLSFNADTILGRNSVLQSNAGVRTTSFGASALSTFIGVSQATNEPGVGTYYEILVLPTKPSGTLATQIRTYLTNKHSIT